MSPAKIQSLLQEGLHHHQANRFTEAAKIYAQIRLVSPKNFDAWHLSGTLALQQNHLKEAREWLAQALRLKPDSTWCLLRLGIAYTQSGEFLAAEKKLRAALKLDPKMPEAWNHLALTLRSLGQREDAREAFQRALVLRPDFFEVHDRLGALVAECDGHAAAESHYRRALEICPTYTSAWGNLGASLLMIGRLTEALDCFDHALGLDPTYAQALTGRAIGWERQYRLTEALDGYAKALEVNPDNFEARSARLLGLHYVDNVSPDQLAAEHRAFGQALPPSPPIDFSARGQRTGKIRVGFLSPDLRQHSVAYFLRPLLRGLNRQAFEIFLYHDHPLCDGFSRELSALADQWRHVAGLTDAALAKKILGDAPDILIDLAGHTSGNRLRLFAQRLAPVQISYLGYPDTTGVPAIDFRLVDAVTDPVGSSDQECTETLIRFAPTAWVYSPPADAPEPSMPGKLPNETVTFGCFNNFAKVSDATLSVWAAVLKAVPNSRLLLKGYGLGDAELLAGQRARLARFGVDPLAVDFLERTPTSAEHLATYARVDIALDTFPYHGTTTTCEALWMGVPVITLAGDRHSSRVGVSLLKALGHTDWVAENWDDYVKLAVQLAGNLEERSQWRRSSRAVMKQSPLMDEAGQAARFGECLANCWTAWLEKQAALSETV